ncbi:hypothetical protein V8C86DRAFT_2789378 [Haematococcus lacustris]
MPAAAAESSAADHDDELEVHSQDVANRDKHNAEAAKALGSMTDAVPERQLDENKVKQAMTALAASQQAGKEAALAREKALAAVKVGQPSDPATSAST